ncbi:MAG: glutamate-5-semialdehyde dehydrogenase [Tissierellia bacterium]|nr:glutamate-5-semialdehyde dehydrogenase [Tissierellia bacterium]
MTKLIEMAKNATAVKAQLAQLSEKQKNGALAAIAKALRENTAQILAANDQDIAAAQAAGMKESMQDRLKLDTVRIEGIAAAVEQLIELPDPVGKILSGETMKDGMRLINIRVPLGVVGIIYESRPNVTVDAATLCLKSGNVCILKGGKEAIYSNTALMKIMRETLEECGLPADFMQLIEDTSRAAAQELMGLAGYLDVLIPRGGAGLIQSVVENAKVPVIETGTGNNHIYVDADADQAMALTILDNAKTQRPSVCNAVETLLVHQDIAEEFLPKAKALLDAHSVEWRGDEITRQILGAQVLPVTNEDYQTEFIDYIMACKVVSDLEEAIAHIAEYGTGHSEAIVTKDYDRANRFTNAVDAAAVYVNCSTRFTDGGEFGLGAEIGISTQKLHVRGPMGLEALTSNKYMVLGSGQIRG